MHILIFKTNIETEDAYEEVASLLNIQQSVIDWNIDKEDCPPGEVFDRPSANHWPDRRGDRTETRPGADGASAIFFAKGAADNREAAWHEKRRAEALHRARDNELPNSWSKPAPSRCHGENHNPDNKNAASAVAIPE